MDTGVIEPVRFAEWATPIVPILKKDGSIRLCGDYKVTLNRETLTESYPLPRIEDMLASLAGGTSFSKLDLAHAYQQVVLEDKSKEMATITTHRGLYRVNRLPFGVASSPSLFQRIMETVLQGLPSVSIYLDDILVTGKSVDDHIRNLEAVLSRLEDSGFRLKQEKCAFLLPSVEYLGHLITAQGLQPSTDKVEAVQKAPAPQDVSQLKSFLGLVNYYGKFLPDLSSVLAPLYSLLQKGTEWKWGADQQTAFAEVKRLLTSDCLLAHYDPDKELLLACDASPYGLGAVLSHRGPSGEEQPIAFASRSLNPAEKNYSQLEKEGLAIVFAVKRFHQYLFGRPFTITSDHKPLQHLLKESTAVPAMASARMQRWALLLSGYNYTINYKPGEAHANADSLSRLPLPDAPSQVPVPPETVLLMQGLDSSPVTFTQIKQWTAKDPLISKVLDFLLRGSYTPNAEEVKPYHKCWSELSIHQGCVLRGNRVVVPTEGRQRILELLHEGHQGSVRIKALARSYVWWPGIDQDLENTVKACDVCQKTRHAPAAAPLHPWEFPSQPWERLHADFAGPFLGKMFLLTVDAYSKWLEVFPLSAATSSLTIEKFRTVFATHGLPKILVTDNGTQFTSAEFEDFMRSNGIRHMLTSPYHPASNGLAERAVQSFKESMKKFPSSEPVEKKIAKFLFLYRLTPHSTTGVPPAQLLLGRIPRSQFDLLKPQLADSVHAKQEKQAQYHDVHAKARKFEVGDAVFVKDFPNGKNWIPGTVQDRKGPLSYHVKLDDGRIVRRHVDHVRCRTSESHELNAESHESNAESQTVDDLEFPIGSQDEPPTPADPTPSMPARQSSRRVAPPCPSKLFALLRFSAKGGGV